MSHMTGNRGGRDDDEHDAEDATQIVPPPQRATPPSADEEATRILPLRSSGRQAGGTVIGVAAQQPRPSQPEPPPASQVASRSGFSSPPSSSKPAAPASAADDTDKESKTVFLPTGFSAAGKGAKPADGAPASVDDSEEFDPLVGWLVIMEGPGRGRHCAVHYGQNSIGRGSEQRIRLDFGDNRIARDTHAFVIYDDVARKFYVRDNGKANLVRLNGAPVMTPLEVKDRDRITIGSTVMMFVALCGPDFDWLAADGTESA
ncbi:MAG: FHA domain-containing protein [Hyphomicrobiaceae bacterium]